MRVFLLFSCLWLLLEAMDQHEMEAEFRPRSTLVPIHISPFFIVGLGVF